MKNVLFPARAAALALTLAVMPASAAQANAPAPANPPAAFSQCAGCHSVQPGRHVFGPSLAGISGRRAAALPGYSYSEALKKSGLTWNAATLDRWLTAPQKLVPGTRMPFGGIADKARRKAVVDYLLTQRD